MKVVLTDNALIDLDHITDYIALDNPGRATSFGNELIDAAQAIGDIPLGFAFVPGYEESGIRRKPYRAYSIFYHIIGDRVDVLHILRGAQDYDAILSD